MTSPDMHLVEGLLSPELDALDREGNDLAAKWREATDAITAAERGVGPGDILTHAFLPGYRQKSDAVRPEAGKRHGQYSDLVAAGRRCIDIYRTGDGIAAVAFSDLN
jgi:hypothetical protein